MTGRMRFKAVLASLAMLVAGAAAADEFPSRPITLIIPWPAGGPTDVGVRAMAEVASNTWVSRSSSTTRRAAPAL